MEKVTEHIYFKDFAEFRNNNKGPLVKTINHIDDEFTDIVYTKGQGEFIVTKQLFQLDNQKLRLYILDEIFVPEVKIYAMRVVYRQGFTEKYYFKLLSVTQI